MKWNIPQFKNKSKSFMTVLLLISILSLSGISPILVNNMSQSFVDFNESKVSKNPPLIVMFGNTIEENLALNVFQSLGIASNVISYSQFDVKLLKLYDSIIFIGHGQQNGFIFQNQIIEFSYLKTLTQSKDYVAFVACNSLDKEAKIISFSGMVDSIFAASYAAFNLALKFLDLSLMDSALKIILSRVNDLANGADPMYLANSESGYKAAYKKSHAAKYKWGVPYYKENIFWLNGDNEVAYWLRLSLSAGGLISTLSGLTTAIAVALGVSTAVATALIWLIIATMGTALYYHQQARPTKDFKIGLGAVAIPSISYVVRWDNTDNSVNDLNNWLPASLPGSLSSLGWYFIFGSLSTSWRKLI